jgi:hypothetical protein
MAKLKFNLGGSWGLPGSLKRKEFGTIIVYQN